MHSKSIHSKNLKKLESIIAILEKGINEKTPQFCPCELKHGWV